MWLHPYSLMMGGSLHGMPFTTRKMIYHNTCYSFLVWADNCSRYKKLAFISVLANLINRYKKYYFSHGLLKSTDIKNRLDHELFARAPKFWNASVGAESIFFHAGSCPLLSSLPRTQSLLS
jgi:hypothetical protein